jgi:CDGSH-type Zn-finger protein
MVHIKGSFKEFGPLTWKADQSKKVFFCTCKQTKDPPMCDGHITLNNFMKNIEVKKIIQAIETSDGAGVKLKRSIGTEQIILILS